MRCDTKSLSFENPSGFIVLEGVNGGGKSTLQKRLAEHAGKLGHPVLCTREPGGTALGMQLRALVQEGRAGKITGRAELLLFSADRAEHVEQVIRPAIAAGTIVLCDRYFYSTTAFQGYGRGLNLELVRRVNEAAVGGCLPDLVLLLDIDPAAGLARNKKTGESLLCDTFELEDLEFHRRIREGFLSIAEESLTPFVVIDASRSPEDVFEESRIILERFLGSLKS